MNGTAKLKRNIQTITTCLALVCALPCLLISCATAPRTVMVPKWERFEHQFRSLIPYTNAPQDVLLTVTFTSPLGTTHKVHGFWDGGKTWRVRFIPNQPGTWTWQSACSVDYDLGLNKISGSFLCTAAQGKNLFTQHGPVRVSNDHRYLMHDDRTPFFWLADTAWNGPLLATDKDWAAYLAERSRQKFSAVQWVTTQWRAAPNGDRENHLAYTGREHIQLNLAFFQRLDKKIDEMNRAGLLSVPVLLWAFGHGEHPEVSPGVGLPDDQAIVLARYMVARWGGNNVVWILNGDGDYRGDKAERWKKIGRAVFGDIYHAPVTIHPGGRHWVFNEFRNEPWLDILGYQSSHSDKPDNLAWITSGPPATVWTNEPVRPIISLEAPYENHNGADKKAMSADIVRRAHYWSLLNAPTAGITYGAHGIWSWSDGHSAPIDHPTSGVPLSWRESLQFPGAAQMTYLHDFFTSIDFSHLRPAPQILGQQPGAADPAKFISAAMTERNDLAVIYTPAGGTVRLLLKVLTSMPNSPGLIWFNPRTGKKNPAAALVDDKLVQVPAPDAQDWVLLVSAGVK